MDKTDFNEAVKLCIYNVGAALIYPEGLENSDEYFPFIHITFATPIFGIIDDMFIETSGF